MSGANRGQPSVANDYHNQENMSRLRGSLKPRAASAENQENIQPKQANRTVLGALQNNQRSKVPNQRGAKQVGDRC